MFRARTAQNVAVNVALQWLNRFLGVVTKVVLVRLLFPNDFGVFALASGLIGFVGTFGNFGLDYAIIQKTDAATQEDYNVGMSLRILIAVGLFGVSLVVAGPWASLFGNALVGSTTQVLALVYLIGIWSFIPGTKLVAELRYRAIAVPSLAAQIGNTIVSIVLAFAGFGVWALVWGSVASSAISMAVFWIIHPWRFRFSIRRNVASPLLRYAQHLVSAAVLSFLISNIDNFTVGYFLGTAQLGFYSIAYAYGIIPVAMFSGPAGGAFFPSLTKIQADLTSLREGYLEGFGYSVALIAPSAIGIAALSPEIVDILFGPVWSAVIVPLLVLCFYGLFRALVDFSSALFAAVGKPRIIAELNLYILVLSLIPLLPMTLYFGILGTSIAMTVPVAIVAVVSFQRSAKLIGGRMHDIYARLRGPMIAAEVMGLAVFALRLTLIAFLPARVPFPFAPNGISEVTVVLVAGVAFGTALYFVLLRLIDRDTWAGLMRVSSLVFRRSAR